MFAHYPFLATWLAPNEVAGAGLKQAASEDGAGEQLPVQMRGDITSFLIHPDDGVQHLPIRGRVRQLAVDCFNEGSASGRFCQCHSAPSPLVKGSAYFKHLVAYRGFPQAGQHFSLCSFAELPWGTLDAQAFHRAFTLLCERQSWRGPSCRCWHLQSVTGA